MQGNSGKVLKIVLVIVLVVGLLGFFGWRAMQPKLKTATLAEIKAVVPPDTLEVIPTDPAAIERHKAFFALIGNFDDKPYLALLDVTKKAPASERRENAHKFLAKDGTLIAKASAILASGALQAPERDPSKVVANAFLGLSKSKAFTKVLTQSGKILIEEGNPKGIQFLILANRCGDALLKSKGELINYLVGLAEKSIALRAIDEVVLDPKFSASQCQMLLRALPPAGKTDEYLRDSLRADFQQDTLKILGDPAVIAKEFAQSAEDEEKNTSKSDVGTFDPIATARKYGQVTSVAMANARKPFASADFSVLKAIEKDGASLPVDKSTDSDSSLTKSWNGFQYRFAMDNSENTIGRQLLSSLPFGPDLFKASCRTRATLDATRILLASILYRASHNGALPKTSAGFVPLLGAWPQDPFNGSPMLYDPVKEVAYSVGENLVDDGGDVNLVLSKATDIGVSLRR